MRGAAEANGGANMHCGVLRVFQRRMALRGALLPAQSDCFILLLPQAVGAGSTVPAAPVLIDVNTHGNSVPE